MANDVGAPESWEVADLDESMSRLMLSTSNKEKHKDSTKSIHDQLAHGSGPGSASVDFGVVQKVDDIVINQVDQFLREALQNPRERLSGKCALMFPCIGGICYSLVYRLLYSLFHLFNACHVRRIPIL